MSHIPQFLAAEVAMMKQHRQHHLNGWCTTADFVLHYGRDFQPQELPKSYRKRWPMLKDKVSDWRHPVVGYFEK